MKIAVCDCDIEYLKYIKNILQTYFEKTEYTPDINYYTDVCQLLSDSRLSQFNVVFLDAKLKPIDGIKAGQVLKESYPNIILVYISDYIEYSIDGYKVDAFRYILKSNLDSVFVEEMDAVLKEYKKTDKYFIFKKDGEPIKILYEDIVYLMSDVRKVIIYTKSGIKISFYGKLNSLADQFAFHNFLRVQRSYMVNLKYAVRLSNYNIYLKNNIVIPTTKKNYQHLKCIYTVIKSGKE
ncbi:MAG: response regulator transcription factor [Ruminococcaceae bacterium]|nr:response regulator transcription factor [Oscillospiraceae bacterium]